MSIDWSTISADWLLSTGTVVVASVLSMLGVYVALVLFTRLAGLRSFSKMSSFDFAITVAFGTILASTMLAKDPPLVQAVIAMAALYLLQYVMSWLRQRTEFFATMVDNEPLLLMAGREVLHDNLRQARVTEADVRGKLREANVTDYDQVAAVVFESTGDISVMHVNDEEATLDLGLLEGVRGAERLAGSQNVPRDTTNS